MNRETGATQTPIQENNNVKPEVEIGKLPTPNPDNQSRQEQTPVVDGQIVLQNTIEKLNFLRQRIAEIDARERWERKNLYGNLPIPERIRKEEANSRERLALKEELENTKQAKNATVEWGIDFLSQRLVEVDAREQQQNSHLGFVQRFRQKIIKSPEQRALRAELRRVKNQRSWLDRWLGRLFGF